MRVRDVGIGRGIVNESEGCGDRGGVENESEGCGDRDGGGE